MHPVIAQAIAADLIRDIQAHADATGRAQEIRRSRQAQTPWLFTRLPRVGRGPESRPGHRPDLRAA